MSRLTIKLFKNMDLERRDFSPQNLHQEIQEEINNRQYRLEHGQVEAGEIVLIKEEIRKLEEKLKNLK